MTNLTSPLWAPFKFITSKLIWNSTRFCVTRPPQIEDCFLCKLNNLTKFTNHKRRNHKLKKIRKLVSDTLLYVTDSAFVNESYKVADILGQILWWVISVFTGVSDLCHLNMLSFSQYDIDASLFLLKCILYKFKVVMSSLCYLYLERKDLYYFLEQCLIFGKRRIGL